MISRQTLWIVAAAVLAGALGLGASVAVNGWGPLLASPLGQWALRQGSSDRSSLRPGDAVPSFELPTLEGERIRLPVAGKPTLINYWASWCTPCREELPHLVAVAGQRRDGLALVPIALDSTAEAKAFVERWPLPGPVPVEQPGPHDSSVRLGNRAGVLPFSALVGADGRLQSIRIGAFRSQADLQAWLAAAETGR